MSSPFIPAPPKCNSGIVKDALVPAITFCHLKSPAPSSNLGHLGHYAFGFWTQPTGAVSLPFLRQSYEGTYISPGFIHLGQSIVSIPSQ
jgi:hypothetical protein